MESAAPIPPPTAKKRGQGRPVTGTNDVGRERLLVATEKLLRTHPPARVTVSLIAKEANADPALVRYYFGDRTSLLVAVADRITGSAPVGAQNNPNPVVAIADHIGKTVDFIQSATFMHRLMIEELTDAGTEESRARVRAMNLGLVDFYRQQLLADDGAEMVAADPLLLHLTILGASDFFATAEPLIRDLVPDGADQKQIVAAFKAFLADILLNGLRKR